MKDPLFLTLSEVVEIHKNQIDLYGGQLGVRDLSLVQSAIAQPQVSFGGERLHPTLLDMASAYAFHVCENHPFFDGNKRTALAACLVFLELNGISIRDRKEHLLEAMLKMAMGKMKKSEFAYLLQSLREE